MGFGKWLSTMVILSPLMIGLFPFQMACLWLINGGDPNHLSKSDRMILQVLWKSSIFVACKITLNLKLAHGKKMDCIPKSACLSYTSSMIWKNLSFIYL